MGKEIKIGTRIRCQGLTLTVKEIISCDYWGDYDPKKDWKDWGFYCEFIAEEDGKYHYWKQQYDGGDIV